MRFPERVTLVEVGPRDGLQSLAQTYPLEVKIELVELLGGRRTARRSRSRRFVRPDVIPQLADAASVIAGCDGSTGASTARSCPNRRGAERAVAAGVDEVLGLITASDSYNRKNARMTRRGEPRAVPPVCRVAREAGLPIVVAIGIAMFCPYEGEIPEERVFGLIERMRDEGVDEFYVATSVGLDGPRKVHRLCSLILDRWPR